MVILHAHQKAKKDQWYHTRMVAYCNMLASWQHPTKRPPSIHAYMPLEEGMEMDEEEIRARMEVLERAQKEYVKKVSLKQEIIN